MCVHVCERGSRVGMTRNDERTIKSTHETCHITVMTSYETAIAQSFTGTSVGIFWEAKFTTSLAMTEYPLYMQETIYHISQRLSPSY